MKTNLSSIVIEIGQGLKLIKEKERVQVCNFADNYYGDQQCCDVEQIKLHTLIPDS